MVKKSLGRGLQDLLGNPDAEASMVTGGANESVSAHLIDPNPYQPRRDFSDDELNQMAESIIQHGVLQPILVRSVGERYQIIAGERRLRAARLAGLEQVPVRVVALDDRQVFEVALVENLQRKDLNAIEKAQAFQDYIGKFGTTHEELANQLGVNRTTVTNLIRLLELPSAVQDSVRLNQISYGHARALLGLTSTSDQIAACRRIVSEQLSVRDVESLVRDARPATDDQEDQRGTRASAAKPPHVLAFENQLRSVFGTKVVIHPKPNDKGQITFHFSSHDEFTRLLDMLAGNRSQLRAA